MKNRIEELFANKKENILSIYFTAGYPRLDDTLSIIKALDESGADIIEVGIPYSDPVADGETIQKSNQIALDNGISMELIFAQLEKLREHSQIPIILMGYFNPVMQYGIEAFSKKCQEVGVDGLILPDLPMEEYISDYKSTFDAYNLINVFLITPQTSEKRIRLIDENSRGFIYMVSSASVTGAKSQVSEGQEAYFNRIENMNLKNPKLIGFGISNKQTFNSACKYASGAIIGSAFVNVLTENKDNLEEAIATFVKSIKA